jgi:hypothetical protein
VESELESSSDHFEPFQVRIMLLMLTLGICLNPTATQKLALTHEMSSMYE